MTNYEKKISEMTVKKMAEDFIIEQEYEYCDGRYWTSDNTPYDNPEDAIDHEIKWLTSEVTE